MVETLDSTIIRPFSIFSLIKGKGATEEKDGEWYVYAPVARTDQFKDPKDYDGHMLSKAGVDRGLKMHERLGGHVDYMHQFKKTGDLKYLIGQRHSTPEIDGVTNLVTRLLKSKELAKSVWDHLQDGGSLGYSLQGLCKAVNPRNANHVIDTEIHLVTIDPMPKGFEATRLKTGMPDGASANLSELHKSIFEELQSGNLSGWFASDAFDLDKALTVGDGAVTPDTTGAAATRRELLLGTQPEASASQISEKRVAKNHWRCTACETLNRNDRRKCRDCGLRRN